MAAVKEFFGKVFHKETTEEKFIHKAISNWHYILLIVILALSFSVRYIPAQYGELQALDPFYLYRMGEYILDNNLQLPELDTFRYHPDGLPTKQFEYPGPFYIPVLIYLVLFAPFGVSFWNFAFIFSPLMGTLAVLVMYFIGNELFKDKIAGLFSAFFLAVAPGFITRTSSGFFEKEPAAAPFMLLAVLFFIKAYRSEPKNAMIYGIIAGVSMGIMSVTWGGSGYMMLFFALSTFVLLLLNKYSESLVWAYAPITILGILFPYMTERGFDLLSTTALVPSGVLAFILIRYAVPKLNILKKEQEPYIIPGLTVLGILGVLIGATQSEFLWNKLTSVIYTVSLSKGVVGTTVAENAPGSWNNIMSMFGAQFSANVFQPFSGISVYASIWLLMILGSFMIAYEIYKTKDLIYLIPLLWAITTVWATLGFVRLMFLLGPPSALVAGFFMAELVDYAKKMKYEFTVDKIKGKLNATLMIVLIFVGLVIAINMSSAYVFGGSIGPSYNSYWDEAMTFMKEKTPLNSSILSWWDFGYWFQTKGERPSIADGGNVGDPDRKYGYRDFYIADWFVDNTNNWSAYYPFLKRYDVDYILMDYTLPGKYGAISKIASRGKIIVGIMQFGNKGSAVKGNTTIYQFAANPYELWIPFNQAGGIESRPIFLVQQNGQYLQRLYVNDMCTTNGIITFGNATADTIPGCVAMTKFGVFYIPPEAEHSIFTSLMFMDGYGLEGLEKVFDNDAIRIYKVDIPSG